MIVSLFLFFFFLFPYNIKCSTIIKEMGRALIFFVLTAFNWHELFAETGKGIYFVTIDISLDF